MPHKDPVSNREYNRNRYIKKRDTLKNCEICKKQYCGSWIKKICFCCWKIRNPEAYQRNCYRARANERKKRGIDPDAVLPRSKNPNGYIKDGYVVLWKPKHPNADKGGAIKEHVYKMSQYLGRPLLKGETVHHKNGIRHDNSLENLKIMTLHPPGQAEEDIINYYLPWFLVRGYELRKKSHGCGTNSAPAVAQLQMF